MREILSVAAEWARERVPFAVATLVGVRGSGPRELGASMVVSADGRVFGNVSGGCVEGAVFTECLDAVASGASSLHTYGISDDDVAAIGLTCGGIVDVLVRPVLPGSDAARDLLLVAEREREGLPVAVALVVRAGGFDTLPAAATQPPGGDAAVPIRWSSPSIHAAGGGALRNHADAAVPTRWSSADAERRCIETPEPTSRTDGAGSGGFDTPPAAATQPPRRALGDLLVLTDATPAPDRATAEALALADGDRAESLHLDGEGCRVPADDATLSLVVIPFGSAPRLIVVGAVEFSVALSRLGSALGFAVTVVDPRDVFASAERFPAAEVVIDWPDRYLSATRLDARTAVCVLSHDPRFDVPALRVALASPAGYVGAMGSRRTHDDRLRRLDEAGVAASDVARLRSPIGLDLGGRTPDETALSILAEIVAVRHGASGRPLSQRDGPVHAPVAEVRLAT